jgi:hypothetical protein
MTDWRTLQFFISENGVHEVEGDLDNAKQIRCNCFKFSKRRSCVHVKHVKRMIKESNGNFTIITGKNVTDEDVSNAFSDKEVFRNLILKYSPIESID